MPESSWSVPGAEAPLALSKTRHEADTDIDMTPIIDVTFQLLIFFMFAATLVRAAKLELPAAKHGIGVDVQSAIIITVGPAPPDGRPAPVFLGDTLDGQPVSIQEVEQYVRENVAAGKENVIVKAASNAAYRDVWEVERAVAAVEGAKLHTAVKEKYE